ncbi:MAG: GNAT family protein [Candidatus Dormibacteraceae bacterium]
MTPLGPISLPGRSIRLEPLAPAHAGDLRAAAGDSQMWRWFPADLSTTEGFDEWLAAALGAAEGGSEIPFAVVDTTSGQAIGSTRYLDISAAHRGVEVGWTWYARPAWGTAANPESKLLLLRHAFEDWGAIRLCLKTDSLNVHSRAAIEKLGARHEGDLRNHRIRRDGTFRHSSHYSILDSEWPGVRLALEERLRILN